jgi:hypothetical protein
MPLKTRKRHYRKKLSLRKRNSKKQQRKSRKGRKHKKGGALPPKNSSPVNVGCAGERYGYGCDSDPVFKN